MGGDAQCLAAQLSPRILLRVPRCDRAFLAFSIPDTAHKCQQRPLASVTISHFQTPPGQGSGTTQRRATGLPLFGAEEATYTPASLFLTQRHRSQWHVLFIIIMPPTPSEGEEGGAVKQGSLNRVESPPPQPGTLGKVSLNL